MTVFDVLSLSLIRIFDDLRLLKENLLYLIQTRSIVYAIIHDKFSSKAGIREPGVSAMSRSHDKARHLIKTVILSDERHQQKS